VQHDTQWNGANDQAAATALLHEVTSDPQTVLLGISNAETLFARVQDPSTINKQTGDWFDKDLWDPSGIPNNNYTTNVTIASSTTVVLETNANVLMRVGGLGIQNDATLDVSGGVKLDVRYSPDIAGTLNVRGSGTQARLDSLAVWDNHGTIKASDGALISINSSFFSNFGTLIAEGTGSRIGLLYTFENWDGRVEAVDGGEILIVEQALAGTGSSGKASLIGEGSTIKLLRGGSLNIDFQDGSQQLILDSSKNFRGKVTGFAEQDKIDVRDVNFNSSDFKFSYNDGPNPLLTLSDGHKSAQIAIIGVHQATDFTFASDGATGTLIGLVP